MNSNSILAAAERIQPYIHRTPVLTSRLIDEKAGCSIFFKCENLQRMGAFKMRGAANVILGLSKEQQELGVVTHSSGNFAQAVALTAQLLGIHARIVMPENAPEVKKEAVLAYGGEIHECESNQLARENTAAAIVQKYGCTFLHPYDMHDVILGQSTAALEMLEDHPDLEILITPVGGGGLLAGTALSAKFFGNDIQVYAGEPFGADDAFRSLKAGKRIQNESVETIADGLRTNLGALTFPIIKEYVKEIIRVEDNEIVSAMRLIWERMNIIIEPSCAVPLAAILRDPAPFSNKRVGMILSGGNVDLSTLPF